MSDSALPAGAADHRDPTVLSRLVLELTLLSRQHPAARRRTGFQLDRSAYLIMTRLELGAPLSLRELAEAFGLDVSTINRQVAAMLEQDLVERVPDPDGGVARKIQPSEKGRRLFAADLEIQQQGVHNVLAGWPDADIDQLVRLIERFNEGVEGLVRTRGRDHTDLPVRHIDKPVHTSDGRKPLPIGRPEISFGRHRRTTAPRAILMPLPGILTEAYMDGPQYGHDETPGNT